MKIALVCPYAWDRYGGVQSHVRALAHALEQRHHEVQVLAPSSLTLTHQVGGGANVKLTGRALGIPWNGSVAPLAFGPLAATGVRVALRDLHPDVVHVHEPLIPSLSLLALLNCRYPAVGTFHAASDEGSLAYSMTRPALRRAFKRLKVRTAVSDAAREFVGTYFPGEYHLTPNGVEIARFADATPLDLGPGPKVLFLGRIEQRKGLDVLIQAMARITDVGAELVVAGGGPEERACRDLAESLGVKATFLGRLGEEELPRIYKSASVYCAPALGGESFGIVLVEALAARTPVVCSDLPGYRSVAAGAAELVPPGQIAPLAEALRRVLTDEKRAQEMRRDAARIASMFDWERLVPNVERLYERALSA